jgi:hypothetical protein
MKTQQDTNMVKYLNRLTAEEKAVICSAFRVFDNDNTIHQGTLPFVSLERVKHIINRAIVRNINRRYFRQILSKLTSGQDDRRFARFNLCLEDAKVYRRFGLRPELGKPLPFLQKEKVTVGVKWSLPKKDYLPDKDVLVTPCVALKRVARGYWQVEVLARCQHEVEFWLLENCR